MNENSQKSERLTQNPRTEPAEQSKPERELPEWMLDKTYKMKDPMGSIVFIIGMFSYVIVGVTVIGLFMYLI